MLLKDFRKRKTKENSNLNYNINTAAQAYKCVCLENETSQSKKDCKDLETIQSSTTPDPGYDMGK